MAEDEQMAMETEAAEPLASFDDAPIVRIYEVGYHVNAAVAEDGLEKVVGEIRGMIEQAGGSFIAEGAPTMTKLAYEIESRDGDKKARHDRAYFGWIKFESTIDAARTLEESLKLNRNIVRCIVFQTVREETRARFKTPVIREVKRTDVIKSSVRREEAATAGPVSEEDLDKAISDLTTE